MTAQTENFDPQSLASAVDAELRALPPGSRTPQIRAVRRAYSSQIKRAPAEAVVALVERLLFDYDQRFVAYELLFYHKPALRSLSAEQVERFGQGIDSWSSVDTYAHYVSGPAWKHGQLPDDDVRRWARASDLWWRRAALVSTVYLYGDTQRTLEICRMLVDDKEDMIVKAMSWALRALSAHDRPAVERFLQDYDDVLAARVKREVRHKLDTGLKYPRRK